jgi:DUF218 domain
MYGRGSHFVRWSFMSDDQVDDWAGGVEPTAPRNPELSEPYVRRTTLADLMSAAPRTPADATVPTLGVDQTRALGVDHAGLTTSSTETLRGTAMLGAYAAVTAAVPTFEQGTTTDRGTTTEQVPSVRARVDVASDATAATVVATPVGASKWRRRIVRSVIVLQTLAIIMLLATMKLFVYPKIDEPRKVDAIVVLGGLGERIERGVQLYQAGYGGELWISVPQWANGEYPYVYECTQRMTNFGEHCFDPRPKTTQGEARSIANLAAEHGWKSVMVVTTPDQTTRARMVIKRCYSGDVVMLDAPNRAGRFFKLAYEWGATIKALTLKRGC